MELCSKRQILLLLFAVYIAFPVIFTGTLAADDYGHDHDCKEETCLVCLYIEASKNFIKTFKPASVLLSYPVLQFQSLAEYAEDSILSNSPVILKVRFNT